MITTTKNVTDAVIGYLEWEVVNKDGQFENNGNYIYIQNIWIHPDYRSKAVLKELAKSVYNHPYGRKSNFVYWELYKDINNKKILEEEEREWIYGNKRIYQKDYIYEKIMQIQRSEVLV